jgi:hypothetical protein
VQGFAFDCSPLCAAHMRHHPGDDRVEGDDKDCRHNGKRGGHGWARRGVHHPRRKAEVQPAERRPSSRLSAETRRVVCSKHHRAMQCHAMTPTMLIRKHRRFPSTEAVHELQTIPCAGVARGGCCKAELEAQADAAHRERCSGGRQQLQKASPATLLDVLPPDVRRLRRPVAHRKTVHIPLCWAALSHDKCNPRTTAGCKLCLATGCMLRDVTLTHGTDLETSTGSPLSS